jgi:MFS transporter, PPP family, 3-phenylpropionic acid transporter
VLSSHVRLAAVYFLFFAIIGAFLPYLPVYLQSLGFGAADIGAILAVGMTTKVIAPNLWAWLSDRQTQRVPLVRGGVLASMGAFALLVWTPPLFWPVALALAFHSFFWNGILPQFEVVTLQHMRGREADYGGVRLWGSIGFVLAVLGVGTITQAYGIHTFLPTVLALQLVLLLLTLLVPEAQAARQPELPQAVNKLWSVVREPGVVAFLVAIALMQASHGPYYTFFTIQVESLGYTRVEASILWVLGVVAEVAMFAYAPALLRRYNADYLLIICFAVTSLRWLMTGFGAEQVVVLVLAQLMHAVSFGLYHAAAIQIVRARFSGAVQGRGQALYSSVGYGVGGAVGGLASGVLWENFGPQTTYTMAAIAAIAGTIVLLLYRRHVAVNIAR